MGRQRLSSSFPTAQQPARSQAILATVKPHTNMDELVSLSSTLVLQDPHPRLPSP